MELGIVPILTSEIEKCDSWSFGWRPQYITEVLPQ